MAPCEGPARRQGRLVHVIGCTLPRAAEAAPAEWQLRVELSRSRMSRCGQKQWVSDAAQIARKQPSGGESEAPLGSVVCLDFDTATK